ncbi:glycosyltransferase [[Eubacterium] hominis]|uniref:glycosyltransferase n=1 Tax=[Eubacterium] hominis TaxID=2764325 RepID=UPI003A4D954A
MNNKTIIYMGNFQMFPLNAAGKRVLNNSKLLKSIGYNVIIISCEKVSEQTIKEIDGIKVYSVSYPLSTKEWLEYEKVYKNIITIFNEIELKNEVCAIINYGAPRISFFMKKILNFCKKKNIICISDCVDWLHTPRNGNVVFRLAKWADTTYQKRYINKKMDGMIVISEFLKKYYEQTIKHIIILPPLSEKCFNSLKPINIDENAVNILYAGIPFNTKKIIKDPIDMKDRLDLIIKCFEKMTDINYNLHIYGLEKKEVIFSMPSLENTIKKIGEKIHFYGLKDNDFILNEISKCDYTILFRDKKRDTTAGFPTKVAESITQGTPVITNDTSDIRNYLEKQGLAFFVNDINDATNEVKKIIENNKSQINDLKNKCKSSGIFEYSSYQLEMKTFMSELKKEGSKILL